MKNLKNEEVFVMSKKKSGKNRSSLKKIEFKSLKPQKNLNLNRKVLLDYSYNML